MSSLDSRPTHCGRLNIVKTDSTLNYSELFRAECERLLTDIDKTCKCIQDDEKEEFDHQLREMRFLKNEVEFKLDQIIQETDLLLGLRCRVLKALEAIKEPLRVTNLCLEERTKCPLYVKTQDEVNGELLKERQVIEGVGSLLQHVVDQISEQIRLNRAAKHNLEQDLKKKSKHQCVDYSLMTSYCINDLQMLKNNENAQPSVAVGPDPCEDLSYINIAKAEQQKNNSVSLRALVESVLEQTGADIQKQFQATTAAIQQNVQKTKYDKKQMDERLPKILAEIMCQQRIREDLLAAIKENECFLSLVQGRMAVCHVKPGKEQCQSAALNQLLAEAAQLSDYIDKLHERVAQSEEKQRELIRCQLKMEETIDITARCLYIDEVFCMQQRGRIIIPNF